MTWRPWHWSILVIALAIGGIVSSEAPPTDISTGEDEAVYLTLAEGMSHGQYRDEFLVGTPAHRRYPPGNAVWIALVTGLPGAGVDALRLANILLWLAAALLTGDVLRRLSGPWAGVIGAAAVAANPGLSRLSPTALSDVPFMTFAVLTAWALLRAGEAPARRAPLAVAIVAMAAGFLMRSPGLALCATVVAWAAWQRRWRLAAGAGLISAVVVGGWFAYVGVAGTQHQAGPAASGYSYEHGFGAMARNAGLARQVLANAVAYLRLLPGEGLYLPTIEGTIVDNIVLSLVLGLCLIAGIARLSRLWQAGLLFMCAYAGLLLLWPWPLARLLNPLVPFLLTALILGAMTMTPRRPVWQAASLVVLTTILILPGFASQWFSPKRKAAGYLAVAQMLPQHVAPETPVYSWRPPVVYRFSGLRGVDLKGRRRRWTNEAADGVLFLGDTGPAERRFVEAALAPWCQSLRVVAALPSPHLLLAPRQPDQPGEDACQAIAEYRKRTARTSEE